MQSKDLFYRLLKAEDESVVDDALGTAGYLRDDDSIWTPLGGYENNRAIVNGQHADATGALVEKIINGMDAVLMAECFRQGVSPESSMAPSTMAEAVNQFFNGHQGQFAGRSATDRMVPAESCQLQLGAV